MTEKLETSGRIAENPSTKKVPFLRRHQLVFEDKTITQDNAGSHLKFLPAENAPKRIVDHLLRKIEHPDLPEKHKACLEKLPLLK